MEWRGIDKLIRNLNATKEMIKQSSVRGVNYVAEEIMAESKEVYCPVKTGHLRRSGFVEHATVEKPVAKLGYNADYAVPVHELDKNYNFGKSWKYLEIPLKNRLPRVKMDIAAYIAEELS